MNEETYQRLFMLMTLSHGTTSMVSHKLLEAMATSGVFSDEEGSEKFPDLIVKKTRVKMLAEIRKISTDLVDLAGTLNEMCDVIEKELEL